MKNNSFRRRGTPSFNQIIRTMRIVVLLLFVGLFSLHAEGLHSQSAKVSINEENVRINQIISQIEKQTDYLFVYNDQVETNKLVTVSAKNVAVSQILDQIFENSDVQYAIEGKHIILSKHEGAQTPPVATSQKEIRGVVNDELGDPVIGAAVMIKRGKTGSITDTDGKYMIKTSEGDILLFSYLGYNSQEIKVENQTTINVTLEPDTKQLETVVVTALGIKRSEKALSYNVQQISSDAIITNKDANFVNALSGKVAGLTINSSSSGVGGVTKASMRGTKSITKSSDALYVIDGVPMFKYAANDGGGMEFDSQGASDPVADINPEDIESLSVLTGAAAAALYGSDAANGAIIITTKRGKEGKLSITVNSNVEFNSPLVMPRFQTRYGTGSNGVLGTSIDRSWGSKLSEAQRYGYDPEDDYFQTGVIATENVSFSTGTDKNQTYVSVGALNSKGIIPNNKYERYNFSVRNTTSFLNDKMTLDVNASYIRQGDRNMTNQGTYNNPLVGAYLYPRGNDWADAEIYEEYSATRKLYTQRWAVGDGGMVMQNPYWINYRNLRENKKDRYMLGGSLEYKILDWLSVSGRVRLDNSNTNYTEKFFATTNTQLTELSNRGLYGVNKMEDKQLYADFLVGINKYFGDDWSLQANLGGSYNDSRYDAMKIRGPIADSSDAFDPGEQPGLANFFAIQNLSRKSLKPLQNGWREQVKSLYASAEVGYKSTYYLTVTGRNDWPSQLAGPLSKNSSFFYPSVGLSTVVSELIPNLNKDYLSFLKIRASYASVGNAFDRYIANPRFPFDESFWRYSAITVKIMEDMKPERTESYEVGLNARFLKNFELDFTFYSADTKNQVFPIDGGVQYSKAYMQTGAVRNHGIELALNYSNTWRDFSWHTGFTYSMNKNKILRIAKNEINPVTGQPINIGHMNMGGLGSTRFILKEGGDMGDVYSIMDLRRDSNGSIYIDENNAVHTESIQDVDKYIKLGSVSPKGNLAWRNSFAWKNFTAGFLISARLGGIVFSRTQAILDNFGVSEASAAARDLGYISINGVDRVDPESWYSTIGGGTAVPQYYTYSATNVRLQEASIGYNIPRKWLSNICDVKVSLVGRNLWMIYNKAPFDPESVATTSDFYKGIDYFIMPSLRNIGFNLNVKF